MLTTALPAIEGGTDWTPDEMAEAFCLTRLAVYPSLVGEARTILSFERAFKWDSFTHVPNNPGTTPPMIVARWTTTQRKRLVVALGGMQQAQDILQFDSNSQAVQNAAYAGHGWVHNLFLTRAISIKALLDNNADFQAALADSRVKISFAGFSLGACVAELLANFYAVARPNKTWPTYKFGAPRLGSQSYETWRNQLSYTRMNVYMAGDPVSLFPMIGVNSAAVAGGIGPTTGFTSFIMQGNPFVIDWNGTAETNSIVGHPGPRPNTTVPYNAADAPQLLLALRNYTPTEADPANPSNRWWNHLGTTYRLGLLNWAHRYGRRLLKYRMQYLELPDNNTWGYYYNPAGNVSALMLQKTDPPPADFTVPADLLPVSAGGTNPEERDDKAEGPGGGGTWDDVPPQVLQEQQIIRPGQPRVVHIRQRR